MATLLTSRILFVNGFTSSWGVYYWFLLPSNLPGLRVDTTPLFFFCLVDLLGRVRLGQAEASTQVRVLRRPMSWSVLVDRGQHLTPPANLFR